MNILYTLNDKFVPQVAAGITSICENNKDISEINFYLMGLNISKTNKSKLEKYVKKYKRNLYFIELDNIEKYFTFSFDTTGWNPIVLSRLLLDQMLPKHVDKILYLDGDTIVRGSLKELWETDMSKYSIAASIEPTVNKDRKENLGLKKAPYYNAGVLLVNMKNWRKDKTGEKIIKYYEKHNGRLFANDQDAINGALKNKILTLSPKYNFYNIFYQYNYNFLSKLMNPVDYVSKEVFDDAVKNPIIIHYLGEERPWRIGNKHKYRRDYIKYLNMTPWKGQNMEKGWRLYFVCFNIFNFLTKPFPGLRYNIMDYLIPKFIKARSKKAKKNNTKIYVGVFNKMVNVKEQCYVPIQLGKENSKFDLNCLGDNTGDNISSKNFTYCELTAQYWMWKNTSDDIVGLVHYRRFFYKNIFKRIKNVLSEKDINKILGKYDIIVAEKGYTFNSTVKDKYIENHIEEDLKICEKCLKKLYPKYKKSFDNIFLGNSYSPFNMIITKKEIMDEYSEWIFGLLNEMEKYIDLNDGRDNYNKRTFGFLPERLLNVWLDYNKQYKVKRLPVINVEENVFKQKVIYIVKKIIGKFI